MKQNNTRRELAHALSLFSQLGITMAVCVIVGVTLGKYLDRFFGTAPVLLVLFALLGGGAAFRALYSMAIGPLDPTNRRKK